MADQEQDKPTSRRGFFREALAEMLGPVVYLLQDRLEAAGFLEQEAGARFDEQDFTPPPLRPPGAAPADVFGQLCTRCGDCAKACPVGAIVLDPLPRINPADQACILCEGLPCVAACKTSALEPVEAPEVSMGLAVWDPSLCVVAAGEECSLCLQACRVKGAIRVEEGHVDVDGEKCTGCGCCQNVCPTNPKAIAVEPF